MNEISIQIDQDELYSDEISNLYGEFLDIPFDVTVTIAESGISKHQVHEETNNVGWLYANYYGVNTCVDSKSMIESRGVLTNVCLNIRSRSGQVTSLFLRCGSNSGSGTGELEKSLYSFS